MMHLSSCVFDLSVDVDVRGEDQEDHTVAVVAVAAVEGMGVMDMVEVIVAVEYKEKQTRSFLVAFQMKLMKTVSETTSVSLEV